MSAMIVIPARYESSRFPGKPLAPLRGATGVDKTLIERTWEAAVAVDGIDRCLVATDDARIADEVWRFGGEVVMTSPGCANGTERCAEAIRGLHPAPEIVVNLQGDAPLTPPWFIEELVRLMRIDEDVLVATPVLRCDEHALEGFLEDRRAGRVGATTAVFDRNRRALYFSKEVIPFTGSSRSIEGVCPVFHHVGVYAYRPVTLAAYLTMEPGPLERCEGLEQLRFMEHGIPVHCVEVSSRGARFWELNNPEDTGRIETVLAERGIA
jgi:3-deoxy-manno-octulosonate cytidylyltransferase (CMP-KDO synthetase)